MADLAGRVNKKLAPFQLIILTMTLQKREYFLRQKAREHIHTLKNI